MTYLQLVQQAMRDAGVREDAPSTLVGASGIVSDFAYWVAEEWEDIQMKQENPPWWFRMALDQTLALSASDDDYAMPSGIWTLDWRTITSYTTAKTDEYPVQYIEYEYWRRELDTRTATEARPQYITLRPDNVLQVYPVPDQAYTLRFDGVNEVQTLSLDADTPTGLPADYHRLISWQAVLRYAAHHEDGSKLADAQARHKAYLRRVEARQKQNYGIETGRIYGVPTTIRN